MSIQEDGDAAIRILCFDAGGPGTYSYDIFMKELMARLASELGDDEDGILPRDHFELMAGTGFGGLYALMLGYLGMTVEKATDSLLTVVSAIFPEACDEEIKPESRTNCLREAIESVVQAAGFPVDARLYNKDMQSSACKVVLYAATSAVVDHPHPMRTYASRGVSFNPTIVEAACATICAPGLFSPIKIGPKLRQQSFIGPAQAAHNPTREAFKEAKSIYGPDRRVAQLISLGCGRRKTSSLEQGSRERRLDQLVAHMTTDAERVADEVAQRLANVDAYLRLNIADGMDDISFEDWTTLGDIAAHAEVYLAKSGVGQAVETSVLHLKEQVGSITVQQLNEVKAIKVIAKSIPAVTPHFVKRAEVFDAITYHTIQAPADKQKIIPITGMGGCGKTQIVAYFLQEHRSRFQHEVYVDASSLSTIKTDLQNWIRAKGIGHEQDTWEDTLSHLSQVENWILTFDNADDVSLDLVPFFPKCHNGLIFLTSRNRRVGNLSNTMHIELGVMTPEEAMATLLHAARRVEPLRLEEQKNATKVLEKLGNLPLAIIQAGSYCHELSSVVDGVAQPYTFTQYCQLLDSHRPLLMQEALHASLDRYTRSVYSTLELSCKQLLPKDLQFLQLLCHFDRSDISLLVLQRAVQHNFEDPYTWLERPKGHQSVIQRLKDALTRDGKWDAIGVQRTISTLASFSIISSKSVDDIIHVTIHPLVQAFISDAKDSAGMMETLQMTAQILTACDSQENLVLLHVLPSHIRNMIETTPLERLHTNTKMAFASTMHECGYFDIALRLRDLGYRELLEAKGEGDPETIIAAGNLAVTYSLQGHWNEAEKMQLEVKEKRERLLPPDHPERIRSAANLAFIYHEQGRWGEAETLQVDVLERRKRLLTPYHLDTIWAASDLATTYSAQGRWKEAEELAEDVLEKRMCLLTRDHPNTGHAAANLAYIYHMQGRWEEAERLNQEVLEKRRRLLPPDHPDTLRAAGELASNYREQGKLKEAELLELEVLERRQRLLRPDHPETLWAAGNLAKTYCKQERWQDALEVHKDVPSTAIRTLGQHHPDTKRQLNVAKCYYEGLGNADMVKKMDSLL